MLQKLSTFLGREHHWFPRIVKYIWILFISVFASVLLSVLAVRADLFGLFGGMPSLKAIENPENDLSSELISADGVSLGRYHFLFNRSQVTFDQLSVDLVKTVLYSEDHRFYDHSGLDFRAFLRVLYGVLTANTAQGGGSTLTQQLAKNLFTQDTLLDGTLGRQGKLPKRIIQKTKEWIISIHLERNFTKEEIMTMYLNTASFSSNAYGIKAAAETYFQKQPSELNLQESAVLVGMLQNPSLFNPKYRPENALNKRNQVLRKVLKHGYIKSATYDSLIHLPIELKYSVRNQNVGSATYFRAAIQRELYNCVKSTDIIYMSRV